MRYAEWINSGVFLFMTALACARRLPTERRRRVCLLGLAGLGLTLAGAFAAPRILTHLAASVVRDWLPALLLLFVYWQSGGFFDRVNQSFQNRLERLDERLLPPLLEWTSRNPAGRLAALFFESSYLLCYPMVPMSMGALYLLHLARYADAFWLCVLVSTYSSYCLFPFLQTLPPRMLAEAWGKQPPSTPVRNLNLRILKRASIHANTFPSAHVAASGAAALVLAMLGPWAVSCAAVLIAIGIGFGTFLGRYHYVADAITGAVIATIVVLLVRAAGLLG